jgi:hypothetical protein
VGSAHPHWHFDVDADLAERPMSGEDVGEEVAIEINLEPSPEEVDLDDDANGQNSVISTSQHQLASTLSRFHHVYLPARTMWHDLLCEMPGNATAQQHTPASEEEIDRWVISALRYLKSEFQTYM